MFLLVEKDHQPAAASRISTTLSRAALVKDERNLDKFDRVFGHVFKGLDPLVEPGVGPAEMRSSGWKKLAGKSYPHRQTRKSRSRRWAASKNFSKTLRQRLAEQKGRHQGGEAGSAPPARRHSAPTVNNPEGVRIGQDTNRNFRAVPVWDKREFKDLGRRRRDRLAPRNIKIAL